MIRRPPISTPLYSSAASDVYKRQAGAAIKGLLQLKNHFNEDDVVVVLFHDHGSRYVGKMFNDDWMKKMGYL